MPVDILLTIVDFTARELLLFAAVGILIGGIDDIAIDLIWMVRSQWRNATIYSRFDRATVANLPKPENPGRIAIVIGAWHEGPVIGHMLRAAISRIHHADYRIYVGTYANDPETISAVLAVDDPRIRLVGGDVLGPTTKAECLNRVWQALTDDERRDGERFKAIVLHDAEDVVHSAELTVFDLLIERFDMVQLPVLPLQNPGSRWIAGHYCDEFAEAHGRQLVVREAIGAAVPSAGVGCAISRRAMEKMAQAGGGRPFDDGSLTEDYEIGLRMADNGMRGIFARISAGEGQGLVAVRAYFPATLTTAVRQKTRWMTGIALAGWDRLGWSGGWAERWMRLRDRRAIIAAFILAAGYLGSICWAASIVLHAGLGLDIPRLGATLGILVSLTAAMLIWRAGMRFLLVRRSYGTIEAFRAVLRILPANIIAVMAATRALGVYFRQLRGAPPSWDKTTHIFPDTLPAE